MPKGKKIILPILKMQSSDVSQCQRCKNLKNACLESMKYSVLAMNRLCKFRKHTKNMET